MPAEMVPDYFRISPVKVRAYRTSKGISRTQLAAALGLDQMTVGRWERGQFQPTSARRVQELAEALGVDVVDILADPPTEDDGA